MFWFQSKIIAVDIDEAILNEICEEFQTDAGDISDDGQACASAMFWGLIKNVK